MVAPAAAAGRRSRRKESEPGEARRPSGGREWAAQAAEVRAAAKAAAEATARRTRTGRRWGRMEAAAAKGVGAVAAEMGKAEAFAPVARRAVPRATKRAVPQADAVSRAERKRERVVEAVRGVEEEEGAREGAGGGGASRDLGASRGGASLRSQREGVRGRGGGRVGRVGTKPPCWRRHLWPRSSLPAWLEGERRLRGGGTAWSARRDAWPSQSP